MLQVPDSAILKCTNFDDVSGKEFIDAQSDKTVGKTKYISDEDKEKM